MTAIHVMSLIYVENKSGVNPIYRVEERAVRYALGSHGAGVEIAVHDSDKPALPALASARYFIGSGFDTGRLAEQARRLRMVHCTSAGVERYLPLSWLPSGAVLTNSSGVHAEKGGTFGCMANLMLNEGVPRHTQHQRERRWVQTMSTSIRGKTVVIYGLGSLGESVAERLMPFGVRIIGVRRSGAPSALAHEIHRPSDLGMLLPSADFLVLTCPLTDLTRGVIGERELAALPNGASVLNLARAAVMDYDALAAGLAAGHLAGAVLDVFDPEPLPSDAPWWDVPGLMVMPHISSDDAAGYVDRCLAIFGENFRRDLTGMPLTNVVDAAAGY